MLPFKAELKTLFFCNHIVISAHFPIKPGSIPAGSKSTALPWRIFTKIKIGVPRPFRASTVLLLALPGQGVAEGLLLRRRGTEAPPTGDVVYEHQQGQAAKQKPIRPVIVKSLLAIA